MTRAKIVRRVLVTLVLISSLLACGLSSATAATLDNACALLFEKLYANIAARGKIVALLPEKSEVVIEFDDDLVPAYGAELLIFSSMADNPVGEPGENDVIEESIPANPTLIFRGSVTVSEVAGHLNLAYVNPGADKITEGDQVFLPAPVQLYVTPVKNLTPYMNFGPHATNAIARMLHTLSGIEIFNLPASNQTTVNFLMEKCRNQGHYGLIVQPYVMSQGSYFKVQLKLTSLFSGQSLGALAERFTPYIAAPQAAAYNRPSR